MSSNSIQYQYNKLFNKLNILHKDSDKEKVHMLQDKIYRKFIRDIVNGKIKTNEIKIIANDMNKYVVKKDTGMWYA